MRSVGVSILWFLWTTHEREEGWSTERMEHGENGALGEWIGE